jgi:CubicO group peptidase (beta-lactamase class C family)
VTVSSAPPAVRRASDGEAVDAQAARQEWAEAARPVLEAVAGTYGATIAYADLADAVQERAGITTEQQVRHWIAPVLQIVSQGCEERSEPLLAALAIRADGNVGPGYATTVGAVRGEKPEDPEMHAAIERLECYRAHGAEVPENARPTLTPVEHERRQRAALRASKVIPARPACPTCQMQLLTSGVCGTCD